jgi:hypothetical protein
MLDREIWDALEWWPFTLPFIMSQAVLFCVIKCNRDLEQRGVFAWDIYKGQAGTAFSLIFYIGFGYIFSTLMTIYFFYVCGFEYAFSFLISGGASFALMPVVSLLPYAQYVAPIVAIFLALMQLVLLNIVQVGFIANINAGLMNLLLGW